MIYDMSLLNLHFQPKITSVIAVVMIAFVAILASAATDITIPFSYSQGTNLTELLLSDPKYLSCRDGYSGAHVCDVVSLIPKHESNNTLFVSVSRPELAGPALDAIHNEGFSVEAVIPEFTQLGEPNTWIYFVK